MAPVTGPLVLFLLVVVTQPEDARGVSPSATATTTATTSPTRSSSATPSLSATPSVTPTASITATATATASVTPSVTTTASSSATSSITPSPSTTASATSSITITPSATSSPSTTASATSSITITPSATSSPSTTASPTPSSSVSPTPSTCPAGFLRPDFHSCIPCANPPLCEENRLCFTVVASGADGVESFSSLPEALDAVPEGWAGQIVLTQDASLPTNFTILEGEDLRFVGTQGDVLGKTGDYARLTIDGLTLPDDATLLFTNVAATYHNVQASITTVGDHQGESVSAETIRRASALYDDDCATYASLFASDNNTFTIGFPIIDTPSVFYLRWLGHMEYSCAVRNGTDPSDPWVSLGSRTVTDRWPIEDTWPISDISVTNAAQCQCLGTEGYCQINCADLRGTHVQQVGSTSAHVMFSFGGVVRVVEG